MDGYSEKPIGEERRQDKTYATHSDSAAEMTRRKWDRTTVKTAILARHQAGKKMDQKTVEREDGGLLAGAKKVYHGWYPALEECEIPPEEYRQQRS